MKFEKEVKMWVETKEEVGKIWAESKEVVETNILPPIIIDDSLGSVDNIMIFLDGKVTEDFFGSNRNEVKK